MSTIYALIDEGHDRVRLPRWNEHAYLDVSNDGPWAYVYDVLAGIGGGDPIPMLMHECARHDDWEPVVAKPSSSAPQEDQP